MGRRLVGANRGWWRTGRSRTCLAVLYLLRLEKGRQGAAGDTVVLQTDFGQASFSPLCYSKPRYASLFALSPSSKKEVFMSQWPPFSRLPRALLWSAILVMIALVTLGKLASWAAPVTAPRNQTVPPGKSSTYLPTVHRAGAHSLIEVLEENGNFSTLLQTLEAANLTTALENTIGPFTLFAPTDVAFAQLPKGALEQLLANPSGQLTQILLFHITPGKYEIDDFENDMEIITQQGSSINVSRDVDSQVIINFARIVTPNLRASNGVIHAINAVLLPPPDSPVPNGPVNAGGCGGDDGCKFKLTGGPSFANNGGDEMKLQLFFMHSGIDGGQPQGDYHLAVERGGQLIPTFADATSIALTKNQGSMGPYNYEGKLGANYLPGARLDGLYYFWVLDGNRERDSDVFQMYVPAGQGEIWIQFDQR